MEYSFKCEEEYGNYSVTACGYSNTTRQFGDVYMVAPIGGFVNDNTAYRYYETPKMAVFDGMKPNPTGGDCEQIGTSDWSCGRPQSNCSLENVKSCKLITELTENGVFTLDLDDAIYFATTNIWNFHEE